MGPKKYFMDDRKVYLIFMSFRLGREEGEQMSLDLPREDLLSRLMVEIDDQRQGLAADELENSLLGDSLSQNRLPIVKLLEKHHSLSLNPILSSYCLVTSDTKLIAIQ